MHRQLAQHMWHTSSSLYISPSKVLLCMFEPNISKPYGIVLDAALHTSVPEGCGWLLRLAPGAAACLLLASVISAARRNSSKHRRTSPDTAATCTATTVNPVYPHLTEGYGLHTKFICQANALESILWYFCFWLFYLMMGAFS